MCDSNKWASLQSGAVPKASYIRSVSRVPSLTENPVEEEQSQRLDKRDTTPDKGHGVSEAP